MTSLNIYFKDTGKIYSKLTTNKIRIKQARNRSMSRVEPSETGFCDLTQKFKFKHQISLC